MKKIFLLLLIFPFLFSCSSDDEEKLPEGTIINLNASDVIGTYVLTSFVYDNGDHDPITLTEYNTIEFNKDHTGKRYSLKNSKHDTFTWTIKDNMVIFSLEVIDKAQCTLSKTKLTIKAKSEFSDFKGTYVYKKVI